MDGKNDDHELKRLPNNSTTTNHDDDVVIIVKEEEDEDPILILHNTNNDNNNNNNNVPPPQPVEVVGVPMEGLREMGPPPFLKKTYDMVDDPDTDPIISWGSTCTSFVVWDPHKLSTDLLPTHFKHNNFSSFIRQLNTYRFRKVHTDRWEFANDGFQKGKKHLLAHIKRRKPVTSHTNNPHQQQQQPFLAAPPATVVESCLSSSTTPGVHQEFEKLKTDQTTLQAEILRLRQQQENTEGYLATVEERLRLTQTKQNRMVVFMIKALRNPLFLEHFIEKIERKKKAALISAEISKKRRLDEGAIPAIGDVDDQVQEELTTVRSEIQTLFSSDDSGSPKVGENNGSETSSAVDVCSENFVLWEKLIEDNMIYYEEHGEAGKMQQSDIVLELEDLIGNSREWGVQMGCGVGPASTT